jgi:Flp pilus assembly protein TadD
MWRYPLRRRWMSGGAKRPVGTSGCVAMLLAVTGCSHFPSLAAASGQPSFSVEDAAPSAGARDVAFRAASVAAAKRPDDARALTAKGDALYAMGQRDLARTAYRAAVARDPSAVAAQLGLGRTLAQSDPAAAETAFLAALQQDRNNVAALNDLGVTYDVRGRHEEAQKAYRLALTISPGAADVEVNLSRSLALSGRADDARDLLHALAADAGASRRWRAEIAAALNIAGDTRPARRWPPAGASAPGPAEGSLAGAGAGGDVPASRSEMARTTRAGRFADIAAATDTPPILARAPRVAVTQDELPPLSAASTASRGAGGTASAGEPPAGLEPGTVSVAQAPGAVSRPPATEPPGRPSDQGPMQRGPARPTAGGAPVGAPYVQLASLLSEDAAWSEWHRLDSRLSDLLAARQPAIITAAVNGRTRWRLRMLGFADMAEAREFCDRLVHMGSQCFSGRGR